MASAYDDRIAAGMTPLDFMRRRLIRLYPMYLLGTMACLALGSVPVVTRSIVASSLLVLPPLESPMVYPVLVVAWSLFFEIFANFLFVILHRYLSTKVLRTICAASLVWLASVTITNGGMGGGAHWISFWSGMPRVLFSFFVGVLIWRHRSRLTFVIGPALTLTAIVLVGQYQPGNRVLFDLLVAVVLWPTLVVGGINCMSRAPALSLLGTISYPLYCLHPIFLYGELKPQTPVAATSAWLISVGLAWAAARYYDAPLRDWLTRQLQRKPPNFSNGTRPKL